MVEPQYFWRSPFLASLLLLIAGMPVPQPSGTSSLSFSATGQETASESGKPQPPQPITDSLAGHLSEPYRNVSCTPSVRFTWQQNWASGFLAQFTEEKFPLNIMVCDMNGKQVNSAHIAIPGMSGIFLMAVAPAMDGTAVVSGVGMTNPGRTFFLAKTSSSGGVVSVVRTAAFQAGRVCEASDHTIWTLANDTDKKHHQDLNFSLVQHYSFERGLLHNYRLNEDTSLHLERPGGGILVCGSKRISAYLNDIDEYIEIDPFTETLKRWKIDAQPFPKGRLTGIAVTERGRVYVSLFEDWQRGTDDWRFRRGLFELRLDKNSGSGKWSLVNGTFSSSDPYNIPDGIFFKLWGADGDDLVIWRLHEGDMSWVRVIQ